MQRYVTDLQCLRCRTDRLHHVIYLGNVLASVSCSVCGATLRPAQDRLLADYVRDFELRLIRKPGRMLHHARRHPISFMFHYLPRGLVSKPRDILEEWGALARTSQVAALDDRRPVASGTRN
jgi:hypothetical protein